VGKLGLLGKVGFLFEGVLYLRYKMFVYHTLSLSLRALLGMVDEWGGGVD
jgi:hypothetical protein